MKTPLLEILVYLVVAASSLFLTAYTVHMVVGGLVVPETEYALMGAACLVLAVVIGFMAWDVVRRRRGR
ncbi:MAG: hypothetical protein ACYDCF_02115 [Burkholderiales bacterium]